MRCPSCGHDNLDDALFCEQCAAEFGAACETCGTRNRVGARFCRHCQHPLSDSDVVPSRASAPAAGSVAAPSASSGPPRSGLRRLLGRRGLRWLERVMADALQGRSIDRADMKTAIDFIASAVRTDRPDLRPHAAPDGTVTVLFTDIEGSTAMTERIGDQCWLELLRAHNAIVRQQVAAHGGFEVKSQGDGFMVAFGSARRALQCAIDIQRGFAQRNESAEEPIRVRIGLHTGEAIREAEDFYGRHVVLASRIADQAQGGEILVSSLLKELTESAGGIRFGERREIELKGLKGKHSVFGVLWE